MRAHGFNLGGEQSGHIILSDYTTTGDGLVAALQVLAVVKRLEQAGVSEVCHCFEPLPQILKNVRYKAGKPLPKASSSTAIEAGTRAARRRRPPGDPPVRHRAGDPRDGGRRRPAISSSAWWTTSSRR